MELIYKSRFLMRVLLLALLFTTAIATTPSFLGAEQIFYSGRSTLDGSVAGGVTVENSKRLVFGSGGVGYNNVFGTGPMGAVQAGDSIVAAGVVVFLGGNVTASRQSFETSYDLVGILALKGHILDVPPRVKLDFRRESGGMGVVAFYDRRNAPVLDVIDPSTWVNDIADPADGFSGKAELAFQPHSYALGLPGPPLTDLFFVTSPADVNTSTADLRGNHTDADSEFVLSSSGNIGFPFIDNLDVASPDRG